MVTVADYDFYTGIFVLIVVGRIVQVNGGIKICLWRAFGKKGFLRVERQADTSAKRELLPWKRIHQTSIPWYKSGDGHGWFVGGPKETVRVFGMPQWVYNHNDPRPLPLEQVETVIREFEVTKKDASGAQVTQKEQRAVVVAGKPIDPASIYSWATDVTIEQFNNLGQKPTRFRWGIMGLAIALIFITVAFTAYFTYIFGLNMNCAIHTRICP